jgi:uncharacterized protein YyaL (SSP411 family)
MNRLGDSSSPYLRQHADNPVDWYPWGDEALAKAQAQDKPLLISIGYSACHWCHVMAHECFEDDELAALMNDNFINIKVDREERSDVDSVYMSALQAMTGSGGWPMTIFAVPTGEPFYAGTYFPPHDHAGRPGFGTVLRSIAATYSSKREEVLRAASELRQAIAVAPVSSPEMPAVSDLDDVAQRMLAGIDQTRGGFGTAPKFPQPLALEFLLSQHAETGSGACGQAVELTLDAMASGGLHDHLGGGFHRYCVDADWTVPHFEKMLYDNAQLATAYLNAHLCFGDSRWREVAGKTLEYLAREMRVVGGGFAASQDADTSQGEGAYFAWSPAQIRDVVAGDADFVCQAFGVTEPGNFEADLSVLTRRSAGVDGARLEPLRAKLLAARGRRPVPARDDKVIASWNGLAIRAFARAGAALQNQTWIEIAQTAARYVLDNLVDGEGRVARCIFEGTVSERGFLDDAALLALALLELFQATGDVSWYHHALRIAQRARTDFQDPVLGFCDTANDTPQLVVRPRTLDDNPTPSGQAAMAELAARLHAFTMDQQWEATATDLLRRLAAVVRRAPMAAPVAATVMSGAVRGMREVAIVGDTADLRTRDLVGAVNSTYNPRTVLAWGAGDVPLLGGRPPKNSSPTAYVCQNFTCAAPTNDRSELMAQLGSGLLGASHRVGTGP